MFLLCFPVGEGLDDLIGLFSAHCHHPEVVLYGVFSDVLHDIADLGGICEVDEDAAHESSGALVDVDADVFGGGVLVEGLPDVLIGKVTIYVLHVQAGEVLQLKQRSNRTSLLRCLLLRHCGLCL